jgi:hypothetical protein
MAKLWCNTNIVKIISVTNVLYITENSVYRNLQFKQSPLFLKAEEHKTLVDKNVWPSTKLFYPHKISCPQNLQNVVLYAYII